MLQFHFLYNFVQSLQESVSRTALEFMSNLKNKELWNRFYNRLGTYIEPKK